LNGHWRNRALSSPGNLLVDSGGTQVYIIHVEFLHVEQ
jgi:hypothetical protein